MRMGGKLFLILCLLDFALEVKVLRRKVVRVIVSTARDNPPPISSRKFQGGLECGKPVGRRNPKIIGGLNANKGEFPFLVSLRGPEEPQATQELHKCGAVLLNKRWILTAAHCVYEYRRKKYLVRLKARLGEHDLSASLGNHQDIGVETLVTHPLYQEPNRQSNDISLLKLNRDAVFNDDVWPACLPTAGMDVTGMNATVAGWGQTNRSPTSGNKKTVLQKVNVPVLSNGLCKKMYGEAGQRYPLEDNQMCAGYKEGGKDSCQGDSGGPLFVKQNDQLTVIGLVSAGIECGKPLLPGIYTRVLSHLDWIKEQINSR